MGDYREPAPEIDVEEFRKVVHSRRSVRKFVNEPIPEEVIEDCLDMAIMAPNSSNLQPWQFYVIKNEAVRKKLVPICLGQSAAKAPLLIAIVARQNTWRKTSARNLTDWPGGKPPKIVRDYYSKGTHIMYTQGPFNSLGRAKRAVSTVAGLATPVPRGPASHAEMDVWAGKSCALAAAHLMLAFRAHGYDTCPMEGFDHTRAAKLLKLPRDAEINMIISAGKRREDGVFHPRIRLPKDEVVIEV